MSHLDIRSYYQRFELCKIGYCYIVAKFIQVVLIEIFLMIEVEIRKNGLKSTKEEIKNV